MAIRAVIFDLDGVVVSTDSLHYKAWKTIADSEGIYFDEVINNRLRGVSRMESLEIILERASRPYSDEEKDVLAARKNALYVESLKSLTPADVPADVTAVLAALRAQGVKIAIGSSSRNTPIILRQIGLDTSFDAVADGSDIERTKPAPDVFLVAARRLGVAPEECLVIEDAESGIRAAKAAGMVAAAVGDATRSPEADYALAHIGDVIGLLRGGPAGRGEGVAGPRSEACERFLQTLRANQGQMSAGTSVEAARQGMAAMMAAMHPAPSFATYAPLALQGVPTDVTTAPGCIPGKAILYLHGGAFKLGTAEQDRHLTAEMARRTGAAVVSVDYRLAPENPFPAGLNDCIAAFRGLLATGYAAGDIVVVGVSAGANLALAATLALKDRGLPLPAAVVPISAVTFVDTAAGSHTANKAKDVMLGGEDLAADVMDCYAPGQNPLDPYLSPLYGDYAGFPPLLVVVGTDEILYDDSLFLAEKAAASGVDVELMTGDGMPHAYPAFFDTFPEADAALGDICQYVRRHLGL
jgi:beta-phosphoglucomutase